MLDFRDRADGATIEAGDVEAALAASPHRLAERDIVLIQTGRDAFYAELDYMAHGPGVSAEATHWLYDRGIRVMGIDAWGWDRPLHLQAADALAAGRPGIFWAAHQADLAYSQIERLANLDQLPPTGFTVACFPLRLIGASAAPARVVAIVGSESDAPTPTGGVLTPNPVRRSGYAQARAGIPARAGAPARAGGGQAGG